MSDYDQTSPIRLSFSPSLDGISPLDLPPSMVYLAEEDSYLYVNTSIADKPFTKIPREYTSHCSCSHVLATSLAIALLIALVVIFVLVVKLYSLLS